MGVIGNERVGRVKNLGSVGKISLDSLDSLNSQAILLTPLILTTLIATSTPACFAGNSKSDPPPSPRLGGGCACQAGTSISVYPPPKSPSLEGDLLLGKAEAKKRARPIVGFGRSGHDRLFDGKFGNVAIKREQRLLADYAEREQRKDCEAGLIIGVIRN